MSRELAIHISPLRQSRKIHNSFVLTLLQISRP